MFRSYDHLQVDIYTLEINTTDNGSVVFRMLVNFVDNGDGFLVTVDAVGVVELTIVCSGCTWRGLILVLYFSPMWRRVRIVRGDGKRTELVSGETVPADLRG
jgi:hypothetical protein